MRQLRTEQQRKVLDEFGRIRVFSVDERERLLSQISDPRVRDFVVKMLESDGQADTILDATPYPILHAFLGIFSGDHSPSRPEIPGYRIVMPLEERHPSIQTSVYADFFIAVNEDQRDLVVVKILKDYLSADNSEATNTIIDRFMAELQLHESLTTHKNVLKIIDVGDVNGRPYGVFEYVSPPLTLIDFCNKNKLTIRERIEILQQVCDAVRSINADGVIAHRDLKPSNILVEGNGREFTAKLIDFGIALVKNRENAHPGVMTPRGDGRPPLATLAYASPEQVAKSDSIAEPTDVYSLGVIAYEILTGRRPFESSGTKLSRIPPTSEPPSLRKGLASFSPKRRAVIARQRKLTTPELKRSFTPGLERIIRKSLQPDITKRYANVGGLGQDLADYLLEKKPDRIPGDGGYRPQRQLQRARWFYRPVIVATMLLTCWIGYWCYQGWMGHYLMTPQIYAALLSEKPHEYLRESVFDRDSLARVPVLDLIWKGTIGDIYARLPQHDRAAAVAKLADQTLETIEDRGSRWRDQPFNSLVSIFVTIDCLYKQSSAHRVDGRMDLAREKGAQASQLLSDAWPLRILGNFNSRLFHGLLVLQARTQANPRELENEWTRVLEGHKDSEFVYPGINSYANRVVIALNTGDRERAAELLDEFAGYVRSLPKSEHKYMGIVLYYRAILARDGGNKRRAAELVEEMKNSNASKVLTPCSIEQLSWSVAEPAQRLAARDAFCKCIADDVGMGSLQYAECLVSRARERFQCGQLGEARNSLNEAKAIFQVNELVDNNQYTNLLGLETLVHMVAGEPDGADRTLKEWAKRGSQLDYNPGRLFSFADVRAYATGRLVFRELVDAIDNSEKRRLYLLATAYADIALIALSEGPLQYAIKPDDLQRVLKKAIECAEDLQRLIGKSHETWAFVAELHRRLDRVCALKSDDMASLKACEAARRIQEKICSRSPDDKQARRDLANDYDRISEILRRCKTCAAPERLQEVKAAHVKTLEGLAGEPRPALQDLRSLCGAYRRQAWELESKGLPDKVLEVHDKLLALCNRIINEKGSHEMDKLGLAGEHLAKALALKKLNRASELVVHHKAALDLIEHHIATREPPKDGDTAPQWYASLATKLDLLGDTAFALRLRYEAVEYAERLDWDSIESFDRATMRSLENRKELVAYLYKLGRADDAQKEIETAYERLSWLESRFPGEPEIQTRLSLFLLIDKAETPVFFRRSVHCASSLVKAGRFFPAYQLAKDAMAKASRLGPDGVAREHVEALSDILSEIQCEHPYIR
ncbi:MAG: hypothetical protein DCC63_14785 [Nitrospira sp.]|nr:MAG: hypothetical protein DCC63_14785 [Nitrospira sp.]